MVFPVPHNLVYLRHGKPDFGGRPGCLEFVLHLMGRAHFAAYQLEHLARMSLGYKGLPIVPFSHQGPFTEIDLRIVFHLSGNSFTLQFMQIPRKNQ